MARAEVSELTEAHAEVDALKADVEALRAKVDELRALAEQLLARTAGFKPSGTTRDVFVDDARTPLEPPRPNPLVGAARDDREEA